MFFVLVVNYRTNATTNLEIFLLYNAFQMIFISFFRQKA